MVLASGGRLAKPGDSCGLRAVRNIFVAPEARACWARDSPIPRPAPWIKTCIETLLIICSRCCQVCPVTSCHNACSPLMIADVGCAPHFLKTEKGELSCGSH